MASPLRLQRLARGIAAFALLSSAVPAADPSPPASALAPAVTPVLQLVNDAVRDQDDACLWVNPADASQSCVIASDKSSNHLFVYDLGGQLLQTLDVVKPGNIDVRQNVTIDARSRDLVVVNQRADGTQLRAFEVDRASRRLTPIAGKPLLTGPNYGGCLYHSRKSGKLFCICTSESGTVEQHELRGDGQGGLLSQLVRSWPQKKCEGAVADDETGVLVIAEEQGGIWKLSAEPDQPTTQTLISRVGDHGLTGDLEGLAIYRGSNGAPLLIVSDQGRNRFVAFELAEPHRPVGEFAIEGAAGTDGIDVVAAALGPNYPTGVFLCHTDRAPRSILVTRWNAVSAALNLPSR